MTRIALTSLIFICFATVAQAVVIHDEGSDGDLSGDFSAPASLEFAFGANTLIGSLGDNGNTGSTNGQDADFITFSISPGQQLTGITVDSYTASPISSGNGSFIGFINANSFPDQATVDGNALFNASGLTNPGAFDFPLNEGTYSFWLQETTPTVVDYSVTFDVVPEPAGMGIFLILAFGLMVRRK